MNRAEDFATSDRTPGASLAAERERQNLSRADIAQRLHVSVSQVEAIEASDYARLPRGTFLRGFVRNYAKAVGLDPEALVRALAVDAPEHSRPGIVVSSQNIRFDPLGRRLANPYVKAAGVATVVVAVAFAAMYWWLFVRPAAPAVVARKAVVTAAAKATEPLPVPVEAPRLEEPPRTEPPRPAPARAEPARAEPARAIAKAAPPPVPTPSAFQAPGATTTVDAGSVVAAGGSVIRLKFRGSAWVEIKDGRGKVLLSRNNPGGSEAEVIGKGPFSVVVGNAPEVSLFFNDREFDLEPHTRVAVARFTVP